MAFLYSKWTALPLSTRTAIAKELGIAKTGSTHVQDNVVVSDGYNINTVEAALEANEENWDEIVARAEGKPAAFVGALPVDMKTDNVGQTIVVQAVNDAPKKKLTEEHLNKKTTRAKTKPKKGR